MSALRAEALSVAGRGRPRLDGVTLALDAGGATVIIGRNGAGKSTLLRVFAGLTPADRGAVFAGATRLDHLDRRARAAAVGWLPQHGPIEAGLRAVEVVAAGRFRFREPWRVALDHARDALVRVGAEAWADLPVDTLSGGEGQRVRLAALVAQDPAWWLLDEPANHLDPALRLDLLGAVAARVRAGGSVLLVTHDLAALPHLPPCRVVGLDAGRVALDTRSDDPALPDAAGALLGLDLRAVPLSGAPRWVILGVRTPPEAQDAPGAPAAAPAPRPTPPRRATPGAIALVVGLAAAGALAAPWLGPPLDEVTGAFVLTELRLPRAALGVVVGATLGGTGAAFQTVLENPLATPSTIGTTAGASLGALAVLVLWPALATGAPGVALGAFVGALAVSLGVAGLATVRRFRTDEVLLAGIAVTLAAGAAITGLQLQADAAATLASVRWALGSLATVGYDEVLAAAPLALIGVAGVFTQIGPLRAMSGGADHARTLGVNVARTRALVLGLGALAVAACVAVAGPIAFVGLVVPHLVRLAVGAGPGRLLVLSAIAGAGFLPFADGLARVLVPGRELPVGVLTATLGAPTLLALLWRRQPR